MVVLVVVLVVVVVVVVVVLVVVVVVVVVVAPREGLAAVNVSGVQEKVADVGPCPSVPRILYPVGGLGYSMDPTQLG